MRKHARAKKMPSAEDEQAAVPDIAEDTDERFEGGGDNPW